MNGEEQLLYTSFERPGRGGGWGPKAATGEWGKDALKLVETSVSPDLGRMGTVPRHPSREEREAMARTLTFTGGEGAHLWVHVVPAGVDSSGRDGNAFAHALLRDRLDRTYRPIELWRSSGWRAPFGASEVQRQELDDVPVIAPDGPLQLEDVAAFVCASAQSRRGLLALVDAADFAGTEDKPLVIASADADEAAIWIAAVTMLMRLEDAWDTRFTVLDASLAARELTTSADLAGVPRTFAGELARRARQAIVLVDPAAQRASDDDTVWTSSTGSRFPVGYWSERLAPVLDEGPGSLLALVAKLAELPAAPPDHRRRRLGTLLCTGGDPDAVVVRERRSFTVPRPLMPVSSDELREFGDVLHGLLTSGQPEVIEEVPLVEEAAPLEVPAPRQSKVDRAIDMLASDAVGGDDARARTADILINLEIDCGEFTVAELDEIASYVGERKDVDLTVLGCAAMLREGFEPPSKQLAQRIVSANVLADRRSDNFEHNVLWLARVFGFENWKLRLDARRAARAVIVGQNLRDDEDRVEEEQWRSCAHWIVVAAARASACPPDHVDWWEVTEVLRTIDVPALVHPIVADAGDRIVEKLLEAALYSGRSDGAVLRDLWSSATSGDHPVLHAPMAGDTLGGALVRAMAAEPGYASELLRRFASPDPLVDLATRLIELQETRR